VSEIEAETSPFKLVHNLEAEAAVLGAMLCDNACAEQASDVLRGEDFFEPVHGRIFEAIMGEVARGKVASPVTLRHQFEDDEAIKALGGAGYLARLSGDMTALIAFGTFTEQIRQMATLRRVQAGLLTAAGACGSVNEYPDINELIGEVVGHAEKAIDIDAGEAIHQPSGAEAIDTLIRSFDQPQHGVHCVSIPEFDRVAGKIRPQDLVILAARPGMGKTAVAISYALGAAKAGHGVLFVSLEMSSEQIAGRMAADLCFTHGDNSVPYGAISEGRLEDWQMRRVVEAGSRMHAMPFRIIDTGQLSLGRLNTLVKRWKRRSAARGDKLELVVIDYLQLMRSGTKGLSKYEDVTEVSNGLKRIAKEHEVGVMALCQLSREVEKRPDKRPILADLRDSGSIEQDADSVIFLLREEYYLENNRPAEHSPKFPEWEANIEQVKGRIEFIAAKRRNGRTGTGIGEFHGMYQAVR
jgi:replicative DNA helicase